MALSAGPTVSRPWVRDGAGERGVELGGHLFATADRDEVDVLTQPSVGEVGAGQGGAADEVDPVAELTAEEREDVGDEVVALDLLGGYANCVATKPCSSGSMINPRPVLRPTQGGQAALFGGELAQTVWIRSCVEGFDGGGDVGCAVAEGGTVREVENCLFRRRCQCGAQVSADAFSVEFCGVAFDEPYDRRPVGERDGTVLARYCHDGGCQSAGDCAVQTCGAESHDDDVVMAVDRGGDSGGGGFQIRNPFAAQHVLGDDDVVTVGEAVEQAVFVEPRDLGAGVRVAVIGLPGAEGAQWARGEAGGDRRAVFPCHNSSSSMRIIGY